MLQHLFITSCGQYSSDVIINGCLVGAKAEAIQRIVQGPTGWHAWYRGCLVQGMLASAPGRPARNSLPQSARTSAAASVFPHPMYGVPKLLMLPSTTAFRLFSYITALVGAGFLAYHGHRLPT
jgi:hypothetical protein